VKSAWISGTKRLTLKYDEPLSNVAFKFNLRRYIKERVDARNSLETYAYNMKVGRSKLN